MSDPMANVAGFYREMLAQWERTVNDLGGQALKSGEFSGAMNKATAVSLKLQQQFAEGMGRTLAALNLPSRDDLAAIGERLRAIEERLVRIEAGMAGAPAPGVAAARPRPARTKKPAARA